MTTDHTLSRRRLLRQLTLLPVAALPFVQGCGQSGPRCYDPAMLSRGEEQMRRTRQYVDSSPDSNNCSNCEFFRTDDTGCGHCEILDGPVNAGGYCTSWAQR